jgi:hypothetical protein
LGNCGELNGKKVLITQHALSRMLEMKLTGEEIRLLICEPTEVYTSTKYTQAVCHRRGKHSLAMKEHNGMLVIITALWSCRLAWLEAYKEGLLGEDRVLDFSRLKGLPMGY